MKKSVRPSKADIERALEDTAGADKVAAKAPSWGDVQDALKVIPTPGKDGTMEASIPLSPAMVGPYQELYAPQWRADAERAAEIRGRQPTTKIRRGGSTQVVQERFAEQVERKFHQPRASIIVPELPWKRGKESA